MTCRKNFLHHPGPSWINSRSHLRSLGNSPTGIRAATALPAAPRAPAAGARVRDPEAGTGLPGLERVQPGRHPRPRGPGVPGTPRWELALHHLRKAEPREEHFHSPSALHPPPREAIRALDKAPPRAARSAPRRSAARGPPAEALRPPTAPGARPPLCSAVLGKWTSVPGNPGLEPP